MPNHTDSEIEQIAELVRQHIDAEDTYLTERMEAFDIKRETWVIEIIKMTITQFKGFFDRRLIEPIRSFLRNWGI